ncbi:HD family phosphohydrolase [Mesonia aestuariivivens]|uniref:HDIG domain-containing protein n=1 Tax=Mesonia aestuariivivens TaxID=2796128 RepID=A0ABS6W0P1_9FLAO|nr:HDIG domain-containing metalloprotein [Mesonia aestuariivivens]MBW2960718.1 HDIG domain-containing protein [Mesonia aestuariivivens]
MSNFVNSIYKNQALIYKVFLYLLTTAIIVYLFPKGSKFKYEYSKGQPWQYENLYAPFDFAILKSEDEVYKEKEEIKNKHTPYYNFNENIPKQVTNSLDAEINSVFSDSIIDRDGVKLVKFTRKTLDDLYKDGLLQEIKPLKSSRIVYLKKGNEAEEVVYSSIIKQEGLGSYIHSKIEIAGLQNYENQLTELFFDIVQPNVNLNEELTQKDLQSQLSSISYTRGIVNQGSRIIARGEVIDGNKLGILNSLKKEYESKVWSSSSYYVVVFGYVLLVSLALLMLFLFIKKYRSAIFDNNTKVTFIFFNILFAVLMTVGVMKFNVKYIYVVPLCILPLTLKAFFDARLGLFAHVITVLILGFIVPNSYEYMFLQIIGGIVTILTVSELYKRANLFVSVGQITGVYIFAYFSFTIIQEGDLSEINYENFIIFLIAGFATLFVQPLIYAYEKLFSLVSDMSLLELSDTNSKLLKELSNKAPGTFHHSLNVANLAEAAANEIGANSMLVRVGALYHDVGKMSNPTFFTENQTTSVNPHDELEPKESARIIINHVVYGIEIAKKHNLPDRLIDFIRTHHGTSLVFYFYKKEKTRLEGTDEKVNLEDFKYPGPEPFSKETAILMMSDSVEAASKSLKEPTATLIDNFVEKIIDKQMEDGQFLNADITFKEIQTIKKVLKRKLKNIYHLRIEYPE